MNELYINGVRQTGRGEIFHSLNPATGETVWTGHSANADDVDEAVTAAGAAFKRWALTSLESRIEILEKYATLVKRDAEKLARLISNENGKPFWEAKTEAAAVAGKVAISIKAYHERTGTVTTATGATSGILRHKPHGVMAVLAPFNFPVHLANGHMVPALLSGNCVVVKPSELTPSPLSFLIDLFHEAGLPAGVLNLVQGARATGEALTAHKGVDGILFTGGAKTGLALHRLMAGQPDKILALELGGNNPLIWWGAGDQKAAAFAVIQSAFLTAGQRCTCTRRLIIPSGPKGDEALKILAQLTKRIEVGAAFDDPQPFMGPLINANAAGAMMEAYEQRLDAGGIPIVEMSQPEVKGAIEGAFVKPAIIDMTNAQSFPDEEHFGPMLQVWRENDFDAAIARANDTRYGLAAGLFSEDQAEWEKFLALSKAGIVNWNRQTTGASGAAPFGGIGHSGNHNPSAYYAADYCAYPVASMEGADLLPLPESHPGINYDV